MRWIWKSRVLRIATGWKRALAVSSVEELLMMKMENAMKDAAELYRLAFLLTGRSDVSIDIAADAASDSDGNTFFSGWMRAWSRRVVIAKAIATIGDDLAESARRTELARVHQPAVPPRSWSLSANATPPQIEEALLAIDLFPRAALLLLVFEGVRLADAVNLLDVDVKLVRKGQAIGLLEFTNNIARKTNNAVPGLSLALAGTSH
jgi:DNA-directed RNA polymerase specialized sigma24 family protein